MLSAQELRAEILTLQSRLRGANTTQDSCNILRSLSLLVVWLVERELEAEPSPIPAAVGGSAYDLTKRAPGRPRVSAAS